MILKQESGQKIITNVSVSYTHLDVYKRQEYTSSILKQFPLVTWSRALTRTNRYDESLIEDCHEQLLEYNSMSNEN